MDRVCKVCGVEKPIEMFIIKKKIYRVHTCKTCMKARRSVQIDTPERVARARAAYLLKYAANKTAMNEASRLYYEKNKAAVLAKMALRRQGVGGKEQRAAYNRAYRASGKVCSPEYSPEYYARNKEAFAAARARYFAKHPASKHVEDRRRRNAKAIATLSDGYVRGKLLRSTALTAKDIPQSLVEVKRMQMQISRMIKNEKC